MKPLQVQARSLESYAPIIGDGLLEQVHSLASGLKGARVAHINATARGGGVAEILQSIVPLYSGLGIDTSWLVLEGNEPFFTLTKQLHNALQGAQLHFTSQDWQLYLGCNRQNAKDLAEGYDVVIVHDPQPVALRQFASQSSSHWVWRCHIDTSTPNAEAWRQMRDLLNDYDAAVFSVADFQGPGLSLPMVSIIPPAIDPLVPKNRAMPPVEMKRVVASHGLDPDQPLICQVSRFDPWKDPLGVVSCFKRLKESRPQLQLAMLGNFADDDPEGAVLYRQVTEAAQGIPDLHIITDLTDLVNPFQALSKVVLQKSIREGFGLTVAEALWKGTPVVGGNVGGIRLQIREGVGGFLVESVEECARRVDFLLGHEEERVALGEAGREHVRANFLMPRLLRDELELIKNLLMPAPKGAPLAVSTLEPESTSEEEQDWASVDSDH